MTRKLGIFDIGSNTVLLTAGRLRSNNQHEKKLGTGLEPARTDDLEVLLELHDVARLGEGLKEGGPLQPQAKTRVLKILSEFQEQAKAAGITELRAAGTAAFRRAGDGVNFAKEIEAKLGIPTQILSGEQEAHYSFLSALQAFPQFQDSLGMIDIGGGSTEVVWVNEKNALSLPIGTVSLNESCVSAHPITDTEWKRLQTQIQETLQKHLRLPSALPENWVAVAATPPALASVIQKLPSYDLEKIHGFVMSKAQLKDTFEALRKLSLPEREQVPGMPPKRAELLPLGGLILWELMNYLGTEEITVSHQGLRYALLREALQSQPSS